MWSALHRNGRTALSALEREVGAPSALLHAAIGWLARENKIGFAQDKRSVQVWLTDSAA